MNKKNATIYKLAKHMVNRFQTRNPQRLAQELNIKVMYLPHSNKLLGMYIYQNRQRLIILAPHLEELRNTVLAHEIGHDLLHRKFCKEQIFFQDFYQKTKLSQLEQEANTFAAHFLLEDESIMQAFKEGLSLEQMAHHFMVDPHLIYIKLQALVDLGKLPSVYFKPQEIPHDFLKKLYPPSFFLEET